MEAWLKESGAIGLDGLEIADFQSTGRGLRARRPFKQGERILTIPARTLWTVKHAHDDSLLGPALRAVKPTLSVEDILAVYILFIRSRDEGYEGLRSHVAALPESYSSTIFFSDDELEICAGSSLHALTVQLKEQIEDGYRELLTRLFIQHPALFPLDMFTLEDYKWALCTIWSRAMDFTLSEGTAVRLVAPFADMLNHSPDVKQCHAYDPTSGNLSVLAGKDYDKGDQVFIHYGSIPNSRLLRLYGFVIPDNPHDSYDLVLQTNPLAPLYDQKQGLWSLAGLESTCTISLTRTDPLPKDVLRYLRIQRLTEGDIPSMTINLVSGTDGKVNDENEVQILQFLIDSIGELLGGFGTGLKKLQAQLAGGVYLTGSNSWAAAHVSLGEQQILTLAKKEAEKLLAAVEGIEAGLPPAPTECANCGNGSQQVMLCSRCKGVRYCGRTCQVAHFKEHKAACRAAASTRVEVK